MNRNGLFIKMLDTAFDKESWYAPLKPAIEGLTAEQAIWRTTEEGSNNIWENINHLLYYKERLLANLEGYEWRHKLTNDETFAYSKQVEDQEKWSELVNRVETVQLSLREAISKKTNDDFEQDHLDEKLYNIILHDAYHTGQIIHIRKMQGSWPSHR